MFSFKWCISLNNIILWISKTTIEKFLKSHCRMREFDINILHQKMSRSIDKLNLDETINKKAYYNNSFKRLWVFVSVSDIGSKLYTVTGVRSHFKHRGVFLLPFTDCNYCRWVLLARRVFDCYWALLSRKVSFIRDWEERRNK